MKNRLNVLVVEDNPADQLLIRQALGEIATNVEMFIVENGVDATEFVKKEGKFAESPRPHLIILDLNLTRKDGREVLSELKQDAEYCRIPIVVFTTSRTKGDVNQCYRLGANAFLTKPNNLSEFFESIRSLSHFWFARATLA